MPDLHEAAQALEAVRGELAACRAAIRSRTRLLMLLIGVVLVVGVGISVAGVLWQRAAYCDYYQDAASPIVLPTSAYGKQLVQDAASTSRALHC